MTPEQALFMTGQASAARRRRLPLPQWTDTGVTDVVEAALDRLIRTGCLTHKHLHVLRAYGEVGMAPDAGHAPQHGDANLWNEALPVLALSLRARGLVQ